MGAITPTPEEIIDEQAERIAELEALLVRAKYVLSNNAVEGDQTAGLLVGDINKLVAR